MFKNRLFTVLVGIVLIFVITLTVGEAFATTAVIQADRSYDQVEQLRVDHSNSLLMADRSYDQVESLRLQRGANAPVADRSYDAIENLRAQRTLQ